MSEEIKAHITAVEAAYRPLVTGPAVAKQLLADDSLAGAEILYEPEIVIGGTRFDLVVPEVGGQTLYPVYRGEDG